MRRLLLFSMPDEQFFPLLFPVEIEHKVFAYMPSDGSLCGKRYEAFTKAWQEIAERYGANFLHIDNSNPHPSEEIAKVEQANILLLTGGNPCVLLRNLRCSGLDKAIRQMARRDAYVIAGYSAGAMVLSASIAIADNEADNGSVGLTDFTGVGLVDYEIFPHYSEASQAEYEAYRKIARHEVRPVRDEEYVLVDQ